VRSALLIEANPLLDVPELDELPRPELDELPLPLLEEPRPDLNVNLPRESLG